MTPRVSSEYRSAPKDELLIYKRARELMGFTFKQAERFPKKYTFTLSNRLKDASLNLMEKIVLANEVYVGVNAEALRKRVDYQNEAVAIVKIINALLELAFEDKLVSNKYQEQWLARVLAVDVTLKAWIRSDMATFKRRVAMAKTAKQNSSLKTSSRPNPAQ